MYKGYYRIADIPICICSLHDEVQTMCRDYSVPATDDALPISICEEDIRRESALSDAQRELEGLPPYTYADPYLETLAVYRKMADMLADHGIILFHGSVIAVDGEAYLFTAASGTGKSTHVRLWRQLFGDRAVMVNDDKPLIRVSDMHVFGTPWDGKHHLSNNISVPLKAICILERGKDNEIVPVTIQESAAKLLQQTHRPDSPTELLKVLQLFGKMVENVSLYRLKCNMDIEAAQVSYNGMK